MIIKKLIVVLLTALTLGCAGTGTFFSGDPTVEQTLAKIAIQQATLRTIQAAGEENAPARAAAIVKIIDQVQAFLATDESDTPIGEHMITAADLARVLEVVLPSNLTPADRLLAAQLSALIVVEVGSSLPIGQQNLPVAEISAALGWVREAAALVAPAAP